MGAYSLLTMCVKETAVAANERLVKQWPEAWAAAAGSIVFSSFESGFCSVVSKKK